MIAVQYRKSIPRYLALRAVGPHWSGIYTSAASPVSLCDLPEPKLPTPRWVRVRPILSGICGSDLATVCAKGSAYLSPLTSTPFVLGHEVVGTVTEVGAQAQGVAVGDRVVLQPALGCAVRGIEPPCDACAGGQLALCRNVTRGDISAGIQTGYCRDTGGAWSESFVAHDSQLFRVPDELDDEVAVLTEPFACALHGVLRGFGSQGSRHGGQAGFGVQSSAVGAGSDRDRSGIGASRVGIAHPTVLVMGCGSIGLLTIAALRALGSGARVVAVAKYSHQREHARSLGADVVLPFARDVAERYGALSAALNAELHSAEIGKPTVIGGADVTFDCVASSTSIDDCIRFTTAGGQMVLVGMPAIPAGIDWTAIWYKELSLHAAYAYGREEFAGRQLTTFELALDLLCQRASELRPLVGSPLVLREYRTALRSALHANASRVTKTVLRVQ